MKTFLVACFTILLISYSCCASETENMPVEQWKKYKVRIKSNYRLKREQTLISILQADLGKSYEPEEDAKRFEIFKENLAMIEEHNKKYEKGEVTYTMGLNKFTDWFPEEKSRMHGAILPPKE